MSQLAPVPAARLAAWCTVGLVVLGPLSLVVIPGLTTVPGDLAATAQLMADNPLLARSGLLGELGIVFIELFMSVALYAFFRPLHRDAALLIGGTRLAMTVLQAVAALVGFAVVAVLTTSSPDLAASETLQALRTSATLVWQAIFGLHCLILGGAVLRFAPVPRVFGALMLVAGGAYLAIGLGTLSVPAAGDTLMGVGGLLATLGEVPLYVYLLGWAGKVRVGAAATA